MDLGFSSAWFAAGVVSPASAAEFAAYAAKDTAKPARYWRWMAFRDFVEERVPLAASQCRVLFQLGEAEQDANLGAAMMCSMLYQAECPGEMMDAAATSPRVPVRRAVALLRAV